MLTPSTIRINTHSGRIIECKCLPCTIRQEFLRWRDEAWNILQTDNLANRPSDANKGIQHTWDTNEEFRWLCDQMLKAHGLSANELDIFQVIELLFLSEENGATTDGVLVKIQFPPVPPGSGRQLSEDESPYYSLWANLAYASGNWIQAKETLDKLTYEEVVELSRHLEKVNKQGQKTDSIPETVEVSAKKESLMQQAKEARMKGMAQGIKAQQLEAIKKAMQERQGKE